MILMHDVTLRFAGGPLDGEHVRRPIDPDWSVMRYEVPSADHSRLRHVYAGCRLSDQLDIVMRYLGLAGDREGQRP